MNREYDRENATEHVLGMKLFPIAVERLVMLPNTSRHARAILDIRVGPFLFRDCFLLGDASDDPVDYSLAMPGKRIGKTKNSEWRAVVVTDDKKLKFVLFSFAWHAYMEALESDVSGRVAALMGVDELLEE